MARPDDRRAEGPHEEGLAAIAADAACDIGGSLLSEVLSGLAERLPMNPVHVVGFLLNH